MFMGRYNIEKLKWIIDVREKKRDKVVKIENWDGNKIISGG